MTVDGQPPQKKQKKERPVLVEVPADQDHPGNSKFARALGSTDYLTREKGVQALTRWLTRKDDLLETDLVKIWKGLFYCFWHSDKAPVQVCVLCAAGTHRQEVATPPRRPDAGDAKRYTLPCPSVCHAALCWCAFMSQLELAERLAGILPQLSQEVRSG